MLLDSILGNTGSLSFLLINSVATHVNNTKYLKFVQRLRGVEFKIIIW